MGRASKIVVMLLLDAITDSGSKALEETNG
jgi:hypothetical protein